ncbi:MAG TPA: extracellular solute-binding protein [Chloroflexota bacterium]
MALKILTAIFAGVLALSLVRIPARAASGTVNVFYAGSLTNINESLVGPAFGSATGYTFAGRGAGSVAIANQIKGKVATPDVVEFADPAVNQSLMGQANGNYVTWYFTYARSQLVIGFDPKSRFASAFRRVQQGKEPWYKALEQHGLRFGRTDPNLDPKGYRAIFMANLAQRVYHLKHFKQDVLGPDLNTSQIFPEEVLVARMLTGQVDAGVFYLSEVRDLGIPYIQLPAQLNLGSTKYAKLYATQHYTLSSGTSVAGAPILYTITIPSSVRNLDGAEAFVRFALGSRVRAVSARHGLLALPIKLSGDRSTVPADLVGLSGK